MIKAIFILLFSFYFVYTQECPPQDTLNVVSMQNDWDIEYINNWEKIEVMTWNIKTFPLNENTLNDVQEIISDLMPDIINFQEIWDSSSYQNLSSMLEAYEFILSYDTGLGIAFRKDCVNLIDYSTLFNEHGYEFVWRYPLKANMEWYCGESYMQFEMINIHFKCCDDGFERRLSASEILTLYIDQQTENGKNIIVAGDYNDSLDDPDFDNSLLPLIQNDNINFVDFDIAMGPMYDWSYPSYPSHIDHILINSNILNQNFIHESFTLRIDDYTGYSYYQNNISDHRPVVWSAYLNPITISNELVINEIMNNPLAADDFTGEWFEIYNQGEVELDLYNLEVSDSSGSNYHLINEHIIIPPNDFVVLGSSIDSTLNGNIIIDYEYNNFFLNNFVDEIILKHPNGIILDEVYYNINYNFPIIEGRSMVLSNPLLDNLISDNWQSSNTIMSNGDYGTPGFTNFECLNNGDVNLDSQINIVDVILIMNFILEVDFYNDIYQCHADIDYNNEINIIDIVLLVDYILGNI